MGKVYNDASEALKDVLRDGMSIAVGGFGICGIPEHCLRTIAESGVKDLTIVSITAHIDGYGIGQLLDNGQVKKVIGSYLGENNNFAQLYITGKLEVEFNPQGTLAERMRAGGAGIAGFYTRVGVDTIVSEGKEVREMDGRRWVLEKGITTDLSLVKAWKGDDEGNLIYRKTARNINPQVATCSKMTIAEVEELVPAGQIDPDHIVTQGIYVQRIFKGNAFEKRIERTTTRSA
ncbi:MAG TPA: succinyl-CoA--3-ketoacid-CoA transferase [Rhodospirillaceae bacterium]|nr:succinyl-CoA--3-ketoacid-CoA transferase [Rhodospirillaceae bacterium]